jgi:hypothetical protein
MKTGMTISTAALVPLLTMAGFVVPQTGAQEAQRIRVRRLARPDVPVEMVYVKAKESPMMLKSQGAVLKVLPKKATWALIKGVDFDKQMIVLVLWETGGPPEGWLDYEFKDKALHFFVQGPPLVDERGRAIERRKLLIRSFDFFAVSKDAPITFNGQERPYAGE